MTRSIVGCCFAAWLACIASGPEARAEARASPAQASPGSPATSPSPAGADARQAEPSIESPVTPRALAYWERRQAKDLAGAYAFYCAAYRARVPQADFVRMVRLVRFDLTAVRVARVELSGDAAQVTVAYRFLAPMLGDRLAEGQVTETWRRDTGGEWCKEDEALVLPFPKTP
jgi:hypothetical protein